MNEIKVTRSSMPPYEEYIEEIKKIWDSRWLTNMGPIHNSFSEEIKKYLMTDNIELFTNGHMALEVAIQALEIKGEVITTPFTFASTTHAIVRNGLKPVFCDIKPYDYTIDENKIEALINENTSAIMPVHVYGNICNVVAIQNIADKYNLKVIYDSAHAFGEKYKGEGISNFGDVSCFSFHATKVFHSIEGGASSFRNTAIANKAKQIRNFGYFENGIDLVGTNAKMNEFCAAMGLCNLRHIDEEILKRKQIALEYLCALTNVDGIKLLEYNENIDYNYSYFPVVFETKSRDLIAENLAKENIYARKYFYPLTSNFNCYKELGKKYNTPIAFDIAEKILCLPLYADLPIDDVYRIVNIIKNS